MGSFSNVNGKQQAEQADPAYKGKITKTFKIIPKKVVIAKAAAGKGRLTVRAKLAAAGTGGTKYQVQYRVKGTAGWKTLNTKKQTAVIKKLKKGRQYQVRIRALKTAGSKKYSGAWSKIKVSKKIR